MKKLIFFLGLLVFALFANGQTRPAEVTPDAYITEPSYHYVWAADTLVDADTLSHVWRVYGTKTLDINIKLYTDFVKDTIDATVIGYSSIDGVNFFATGDTITVTDLVADAMDSEVIDLDNFMYPYLKVTMIQAAGDTATCVPKLFLYAKEN